MALSMKLMAHHPSHFGKNAPMIKVISKVLIDSYVNDAAFGELGIIELKSGVYQRGKTKIPFTWNNEDAFFKLL